MKKITVVIVSMLIMIFLTGNSSQAQSITKPFNFQAGQPAKANEVNSNFDVLYNKVNEMGQYVNKPIIWSGGCANPQNTCVFEEGKYIHCTSCCTDRVDFDTIQSYLQTTNAGIFTVLISGFYRIHIFFSADVNITANLYVNGISIESRSINTCWADAAGAHCVPYDSNLDITWPFNAGDTFYLDYSAGNYYFPAHWPSFRLQVSYVGQK